MACGESPAPAGLSLDAVLGHGLLAGAGQALVLLRALPDPSAPAAIKINEAQALIQPQDAVLTTSYLVPQLSQRTNIGFPKTKRVHSPRLAYGMCCCSIPLTRAGDSSRKVQQRLLNSSQGQELELPELAIGPGAVSGTCRCKTTAPPWQCTKR